MLQNVIQTHISITTGQILFVEDTRRAVCVVTQSSEPVLGEDHVEGTVSFIQVVSLCISEENWQILQQLEKLMLMLVISDLIVGIV